LETQPNRYSISLVQDMRQQVHFTRMANNSCPILLRRVLQKDLVVCRADERALFFKDEQSLMVDMYDDRGQRIFFRY
jgi:predicted transcriptional regulator